VRRRIEPDPLDSVDAIEPPGHDRQGLGVVVDEDEAPAQFERCGTRRSASGEEVKYQGAGP
jgi:hypothetical protein